MSGDRASIVGQFVTLGIDREVFAVPVETVLEILDVRPTFRVPSAPPYLAGLIEVRGRGVPVIDLRTRLGLAAAPATEHTRIVVLEVPLADRRLVVGLLADRVFEVASLDDGALGPPPDIGAKWRSDYIASVGCRGDSFVVVLNLPRLFANHDAAFPNAANDTGAERGAA